MNIFVIILVVFAIVGFVDKAIGGRFGLAVEVDTGLSMMGTSAVYILGIYCIGVTLIQNNADVFAGLGGSIPIDPSILIGCILAPDLGAQPIALGLSGSETVGYFSGIIVAGCLGQFISFQLPVIFSMLDSETKRNMVSGFIYGVATIPIGLVVGGLVIGLDFIQLLVNISIIALVCAVILVGFLINPDRTERVLLVVSALIKSFCQILFAVVVASLFIPNVEIVALSTVTDALYLLLRMTVIVCGGLVIAKIIVKFAGRLIEKLAMVMGTDRISVIGLLLNVINSLAIVPLLKDMDGSGLKINAAFSVSGAYLLGGQLAFVALVAPHRVFVGYVAAKLSAGIASLVVAVILEKRTS